MKRNYTNARQNGLNFHEIFFNQLFTGIGRYYIIAISFILLFVSVTSCELFENIFPGKAEYAGSEWRFTITQARGMPIDPWPSIGNACLEQEESSGCENWGASVTTYSGRFTVDKKAEYRGSNEYALNLEDYSIIIEFEHHNWRSNNTDCTPHQARVDLSTYLDQFTGSYVHHEDEPDIFELGWSPSQESRANIDHSFASECVGYEFGTVSQWTEYYWPYHSKTYFEANAKEYVKSYTEEDITEVFATQIQLDCISGCEPEEDPCDEEEAFNSCDEFKESVMEFCQTLDDWMVVSTQGDSDPVVVCETADCSGPISRNSSQDPWVGITYHYDSQCSQNEEDIICEVECYGWAKE